MSQSIFRKLIFRNGKWNWNRILTTDFREPSLIRDSDIQIQHFQFFWNKRADFQGRLHSFHPIAFEAQIQERLVKKSGRLMIFAMDFTRSFC